jgi:hypothetical protein
VKRVVLGEDRRPVLTVDITPEAQEEVDSSYRPPIRGTRASDASDAIEEVSVAVVEACRKVAGKVRRELAEIAPDEFELTFGVAIGAEGGLPMITKAHADANFQVRVSWKKAAEPTSG